MADKKTIFDAIYRDIFDDIYNYSDITLKNNVKLAITNNGKPIRGMIYNNVLVTMMPDTTNSFYVFMCDDTHTSDLLRNTEDGWVDTESLLNDHQVNIDTITTNNRIIPKRLVYTKYSRCGRTIIAIDASVYRKYEVSAMDTYITINVDTNIPNDRYMLSHIPGINDRFIEIITAHSMSLSHQVFGMVNGYCYRYDKFSNAGNPNSDYIELYIDRNISFEFSVDLADRNNYWSSEEQLYKDVFIIPRELTNGLAFTFDTITAIVRDRDGRGIILPYLASMSISTLTHTSFGISSYLIDAALDKLGVDDGIIYFKVANYGKTNILGNNGKVTELLYQKDDTYLLDALMNRLNQAVPGWAADELESSTYSKCLSEIAGLSTYNEDNISKQIQCLGYYEYMNRVCKHNGEIPTNGNPITSVSIPLPMYWLNEDIHPILYIDGNKISDSRYIVTNNYNALNVEFNGTITPLFNDSVIAYSLILNERKTVYQILPDAVNNNAIINIKRDRIRVYIHEDIEIFGLLSNATYGYREIDIDSLTYFTCSNTDDGIFVTFNANSFNREFIFMSDDIAVFHHQTLDISAGNTIVYIPMVETTNTGVSVPVLIDGIYDVYLNDRYLVADIDYIVVKMTSPEDSDVFSGYQIVIQNLKFLSDTEPNKLEIYQMNRLQHRIDTGYIINNVIPKNVNNEAYIPGISRLFINGKLIPDSKVTIFDDRYEIDPYFCNNGDVYRFVIGISTDFYNSYVSNIDPIYFSDRADITNHLIHNYTQNIPDIIIVPFNHKIYSSYLNEVIRRILADEVFIQYINDDDDILAQIAQYNYMKAMDVIFKMPSSINTEYIDLYPSYLANIQTDDLNKYLFINRLVKIILQHDITTDGTVVYIGR